MRPQKFIPPASDVHHLQVRLEELLAVQIMPIIHHHAGLWIKAVDQISAPIVRTQHRPTYFMLLEIIYRLYWHTLRVEVCIHQGTGPETTAVCGDRQRHHNRENRPQMTALSYFDIRHSLNESAREARGVHQWSHHHGQQNARHWNIPRRIKPGIYREQHGEPLARPQFAGAK